MKKLMRLGLVTMVVAGLTIGGCKKNDKEETETNDDGIEQSELSADESAHSNELEAMLNEVNLAVSASGFGKGTIIVGATIDDTTYISAKKIVITYNGKSGDGQRMRTGVIILQLINGNSWTDAGAVLKIEAINFKVAMGVGKSISFNGIYYITNVNGGRAWEKNQVVHRVRGKAQLQLGNGNMRSWEVARLKIYTNDSGIFKLSIAGDTTVGGYSNVVVWGQNRAGKQFYTQTLQAVRFNSICTSKPIAGVKVHNVLPKAITVTFGVNASGNPHTGSGCPYGFKINWENGRGKTQTKVIAY